MTTANSFLKLSYLNDGQILLVELNRANKLNTFNEQAFQAFEETFIHKVRPDPQLRCVVILASSPSKHFSAGLDLQNKPFNEMLTRTDLEMSRKTLFVRSFIQSWQKAFTAIEECGKPVLVGVNGACIGAGVDLISACDIRVCTSDAYFSIKEIDVGLVADLGSLQRMSKICGNGGLIRELAFTGRFFGSREAYERVGFVSHIYETRDLMIEKLMGMAKEIAAKSPVAVLGTKVCLNHARDHSVQEGLEFVTTWNAAMLQSEDVQLSIMGMLKKEKVTYAKL